MHQKINKTIEKIKSNIYITDKHKHTKFNISKNIIFFYNRFKIWLHDINEVWIDENKLLCDFSINELERETYIKEIRTCSNPMTCAIIVCMSP